MSVYNGRTVFTRGAFAFVAVGVATLLFAAGAAFTFSQRGWDWLSLGLTAVTVILGLGGLLETVIERVELTPEALVVRRLWGTQRYPIRDIARVEEAKGATPAVQLAGGRWVKLPDVGGHFGNSARAWLRAHHGPGRSVESPDDSA